MSSLYETTDAYEKMLTEYIEKKYQPILGLLKKLKDLLTKKKISLNKDEESVLKTVFTTYDINTLISFEKLNSLYKELHNLVGALNPAIRWLPETDKDAIYSYYMGDSPWSFTLIHENGKKTITMIQEEIMLEYNRGELEALNEEAAIGDTIFFLKNDKMNRGVITSIEEDSYGIANIDNGHCLFCDKEEMFFPTMNVQLTAAQSVHCCIVCSTEYDESLWCNELERLFKPILAESKLRFANIKKDSSVPPKFITRIIGINDLNVEVDLTDWLENDILKPWLSEGKPSGISATKFFAKRFQDPFKKQKHNKTGNTPSTASFESLSPVSTSTPILKINETNKVIKTEPIDLKVEEIRRKLNEQRLNFLKATKAVSQLNINAPAFEPNPVPNGKTTVNNINIIKSEPADDICQQYLNFNYCLKRDCDKVHKTDDDGELPEPEPEKEVKIYKDAFNQLKLPKPADTVLIKVLNNIGGISFYGCLNNTNFSIGYKKVTINDLMKEINYPKHTKGYKKLGNTPFLIHTGDIVLAMCSDGQFHRSRVVDAYKTGFIVFQVDSGLTESVSFEDVRMIDHKFLELPFQAIRMTLAGISCAKQTEAEEFLNSMVDNTFKAEVMHVDDEGKSLGVKVYFSGYPTSVNELLVQIGICFENKLSY